MIEQLGPHSDWDLVEQRGNPVAIPPIRGYLLDVSMGGAGETDAPAGGESVG